MFHRRSYKFQQEFEKLYEDREIIVREGDYDREMYVIQEGEVAITKKVGNKELMLATMAKGDFFGEMSLLESEPRSATVRSIGRTKLLVIQSGGFLLKIRRDPTFAFEMLQRMSSRIRALHQKLINALQDEAITEEQLNRIVLETLNSRVSEPSHED